MDVINIHNMKAPHQIMRLLPRHGIMPILRSHSPLRLGILALLALSLLIAPTKASNASTEAIAPLSPATIKRVYELLNLGKRSLAQNNLEDALTYFNAVLELDKNFPEAYFRLGVTHIRLEQLPEGIKAVKKSIELAPNVTGSRFSLASLYRMTQQMDKAIEEYKTIIKLTKNPREKQKAQQRIKKIKVILEEKRIAKENKLKSLEEIALTQPSNIPVQLQLAEIYLKREIFEKAEIIYARIVELDPSHSTARLRLAELFKQDDRIDKALEQVEILLQDLPSGVVGRATIDITINLVSQQKVKETEKAIMLLKMVITADANNPAGQSALGILYHGDKQLELAEEHFNIAAELDPKNPLIHANLANLYLDMNQAERAQEKLETIIALDQAPIEGRQANRSLVSLYIKLGSALIKKGEMTQGKRAYEHALVGNEENPDILLRIGQVYFSINALEVAKTYLEKAVAADSNHPQANYYLSLIYDESGLYDKAVEAYSKLVGYDGSDAISAPEIANKIAMVLAKKAFNEGRLKEAEEILSHTVTQVPDEYMAHMYLAMIYQKSQRSAKATTEFEEVIRIKPEHMGARMQLGQLYEQQWLEEDALAQYNLISRSQSGGGGDLIGQAEQRQLAISKQINGMSYSLTQTLSFDNNANLSASDPKFQYRSDISLNATYRYKIAPKIRFRLSLTPSYSGTITTQTDFLNLSLNPSITFGNGSEGVELDYRQSTASDFLQEETDISRTRNYSVEVRKKIHRPRPSSEDGEGQRPPSPWTLRTRLSYRQYTSIGSEFLNTTTYTAQLFVNTRLKSGQGINLGYNLTRNLNEHIAGKDNAYIRHTLSSGLSMSLIPKWTSDLRYNFTYTGYTNPDSVARTGVRRKSFLNSISLSLSYSYSRQVRFFGGYSWTHNRANLPISITLSNREIIQQSASLGDYSKQSISMGVGLSF